MTTTPRPGEHELERVTDRLKLLDLARAIRDPQLNYALGPFRGHPPTALMCANATCTEPFAWCGLDAGTGQVHFSPTGPVDGRWDPTGGQDVAVPVAMPGEPLLRWRFRCNRCQRRVLLSNSRMIVLIVRALASGRESITPAAE